METTLTIRLPAKQREALRRRAAAEKRTESTLVRDLIDREIQRGFDFDRVRHLVGSIASPPKRLRGSRLVLTSSDNVRRYHRANYRRSTDGTN
jgi:hypothetical protein